MVTDKLYLYIIVWCIVLYRGFELCGAFSAALPAAEDVHILDLSGDSACGGEGEGYSCDGFSILIVMYVLCVFVYMYIHIQHFHMI